MKIKLIIFFTMCLFVNYGCVSQTSEKLERLDYHIGLIDKCMKKGEVDNDINENLINSDVYADILVNFVEKESKNNLGFRQLAIKRLEKDKLGDEYSPFNPFYEAAETLKSKIQQKSKGVKKAKGS